MTFRDDHDAALARADALEEEIAREKAEREKLEAKVKELEQSKAEAEKEAKRARREEVKAKSVKPPKKPRPSSDSESSSSSEDSGKPGWIFGGVLASLLLVVMAIALTRDCGQRKKIEEWDKKSAERTAYAERWSQLTSIEPCMWMIAYDGMKARTQTPDKADPRRAYVYNPGDRLEGNCLGGAEKIVVDPGTSPKLRGAVQQLLDVQHALKDPAHALSSYYSNNDWKEDDFTGAPKLWEPVLALLAKQVEAIARFRRDARPELVSEIRALQKVQESRAKDDTWWRVELAMQLRAICDRGYDAAGIFAGRPADHAAGQLAIVDPVKAFLGTVKEAPIEIRRIVRKVDYLLDPIAAGTPYTGETPLWHLCNVERDLIGPAQQDAIPGMPPPLGPRPEEPSD